MPPRTRSVLVARFDHPESLAPQATVPRAAAERLPRLSQAAYTQGMRIVGTKDRMEVEMNPAKAHRRGLALDAMLREAAPKRTRGVAWGTHAHFNRVDEARQALAARALNVA